MKPGVVYKQKDLSQVVVGSDSSILGIGGNAKWGPVDELTPIANLDQYVQLWGKPVSPSETPVFYQLLGWFKGGKSCYMIRPQGGSKYGGVEALKDTVVAGIAAGLDALPTVPSGSNVIGLYSKYPGVHDEGSIYVWIFDVDDTAGTFGIQVGVKLDTAGTALDTGDSWFEEHRVSVISTAKDGFGRSLFIEDVLERDSQLLAGRAVASAAVDDVPAESVSILALANQSYTKATDGEVATAYEDYKSLDDVTVNLMVPGNFSDDVLNKVAEVAVFRGDCFYILSPDISETWTVEGISGTSGWLSRITGRDEEGAVYAMYYKVKDEYNDRDVYIPAAGHIAGAFADSDSQAEVWFPPAGSKRGVQRSVELAVKWLSTEQDTLYDRNVNFVVKSPTSGVYIEGQKTLYPDTAALDRINVSRLVLKVKNDLIDFLQAYIYELNTSRTRLLIKNGIDGYLRDIRAKQGLYDFRTICDESNNTAQVIDNNQLVVTVMLKPPKAAEFIYLNTIITATGVDFDVVISAS